MAKKSSIQKVVVITGASSGIGLITAKHFVKNGYKVYGLSRNVKEESDFVSLSCDVTNIEQIKESINYIMEKENRIDVLINNAGFGISGSVENEPLDKIESLIKVNFLGAVAVTQQVLPIMRKQGGGKILNTSSVASVAPIPYQSFYSVTKASLDIWAKALRMEVKPFNIEVCSVQLGDTKTGFTASRQKSVNDEGTVYEAVVAKSIAKMEKDEQYGKDPITAAKTMLKLVTKKHMPATKVVGLDYKFLVFLIKILPQKLVLFILNKLYS